MNDDAPAATSEGEISDGQWIALHVIEICTASLSIIGSATLIFKIVRDGHWTPYDRIVLGVSASDIIASITWAIGQFLFPIGSHVWAFGNVATCHARGFLTQLSVLAWWYNGLLSYLFLLTVLSQVRRRNYLPTFEPWMHLSGAFFLIIAVVGLCRGWYSEDSDICWIEDRLIAGAVGVFPLLFMYFSTIINHCMIYAIVQKSLQSSQHITGSESVRKRIKQEATTLMFLYVASFVVCVTPSIVLQLWGEFSGDTTYENKFYPLWVLNAIFLPLQGFFNFFIYICPAYTRFRAANRTKSIRFVLYQALFNPKTPQLYYSSSPHDPLTIEDVTEGSSTMVFESHRHLSYSRRGEESESDSDDDEDSIEDAGRCHRNSNCRPSLKATARAKE